MSGASDSSERSGRIIRATAEFVFINPLLRTICPIGDLYGAFTSTETMGNQRLQAFAATPARGGEQNSVATKAGHVTQYLCQTYFPGEKRNNNVSIVNEQH